MSASRCPTIGFVKCFERRAASVDPIQALKQE